MPSQLSKNHQGGSQAQNRIMPGQRRQLAAVGRLIQIEEHQRQIGMIAKAIEQAS